MNEKRIDAAIKQFETAARNGVKLINELTQDSLKDSPFEKTPLDLQAQVLTQLKAMKAQAASNARFEGMSAEEIGIKQDEERETERQTLLEQTNAKLAARYVQPEPEPVETDEGQSDSEDANNA